VEHDHAPELCEPGEKAGDHRVLPVQLDVIRHARDPDEVERALAHDLVGDVDIPTPGVPRLGSYGARHLVLNRVTAPATVARRASGTPRVTLPSIQTTC